jgi:SAM-dependent methyltransferase
MATDQHQPSGHPIPGTTAPDAVPAAGGSRHWFEDVADHLGGAYLRYSFTRGTAREVDALWDVLGLHPGCGVLDIGCGPGRHAGELARRGARVVGVDVSERFLGIAHRDTAPTASFVRADARRLPFAGCFDAAISLCQGAFGLNRTARDVGLPLGPDPDEGVLAAARAALRPGGTLALTAFSAYFQVRWLEDHDTFDPATGCNHERTEIRDERGATRPADLYTTCFTPRELCLLADKVGFEPLDVWSVAPGDYSARAPDLEHPEWLLLARRR